MGAATTVEDAALLVVVEAWDDGDVVDAWVMGDETQYARPTWMFVHPELTPVFQIRNWDNVIENVVSILVQVSPDTTTYHL